MTKLVCGDNKDVLPTLAEESIDMVLTSPPYDNLRTYNGYSFDIDAVVTELWRVLKTGGVIIWVVNDATVNGSETGTSFRQALRFIDNGFKLHDTMIYKKQNPMPSVANRYVQCFEYIFCFSKGKPKTFNGIRVPCKYAGISNFGDSKKSNQETVCSKRFSHSYLIGF